MNYFTVNYLFTIILYLNSAYLLKLIKIKNIL